MSPTIATMPGKPKQPPTETVRLNHAMMRKIRLIADSQGLTTREYIEGKLIPFIEKEIKQAAKVIVEDEIAEAD